MCLYKKKYPENFTFLILKNSRVIAREVCKFPKM